MSGIFKAEWLKLQKRPAIRSIVAIWLALVLLLGYLLPYLVFKNPPPGRVGARFASAALLPRLLPTNLVHWFVPTLSSLGGTLILVLAALIGGSEFGWSTLTTILTQRPGRLSVFTGKLLAIAVLLVLFVVLGYVAAAIGSLIVALLQHATVTWPPAADLARSAGAMFLIFGAWTAFGLGLAVLFQGTALAIGLGLAYALVIDRLVAAFSSISDIVKTVSQGLLGTNASALVDPFRAAAIGESTGASAIAGPGQAAIVLGAYIVVFVVLAGILLQRRDVT
jgi:ABC-type transport system involved in multi-copper enzyme maturation permease subunit